MSQPAIFWKMKDGTLIMPFNMRDSHLLNCVRAIIRKHFNAGGCVLVSDWDRFTAMNPMCLLLVHEVFRRQLDNQLPGLTEWAKPREEYDYDDAYGSGSPIDGEDARDWFGS